MDSKPFTDVYYGLKSESLKRILPFPGRLNQMYHESTIAFSPDGNTVYFTRVGQPDTGTELSYAKIYAMTKENAKWGKAVLLDINRDGCSCAHSSVSPDGRRLYFASDCQGTNSMIFLWLLFQLVEKLEELLILVKKLTLRVESLSHL